MGRAAKAILPRLRPRGTVILLDRLGAYWQALGEQFCITITDARGRILEANGRYGEPVGYSEGELLQEALDSGAFRLVYQPVISTGDAPTVSFEALLRWNHPQHGVLSPAAFADVFDDPMMASSIGKWVIDRAIAQAAEWERAGYAFGRVAVNVTSADFAVGGLAEYVESTLVEHGIGSGRLCVEVTEHVFLRRGAVNVTETLDKLHAMGVEIALDDFGTGYASLSHVKKFPIDRLKVDKTFVHDMDHPDDLAIVLSIIQLGESLGIKVTAEGVETEEQLHLLRSMGCSSFQGYFFSKPLDAQDVPGFLGDGGQALVA